MMNLAELQEAEVHRRLKLLGTTREDASGAELRKRSRQVDTPVAVLRQWHARYLHGGFDALLPSWSDITEPVWALIGQRYAALGVLAEAETLSENDVCALATRQRWTMPQARRWLARYRVDGMAGLAPRSQLARSRTVPDLGTLSETQQDELFRRHALLGELAEQEHVSNSLLQKQAEAAGVSLRTLRDYHTRFRRQGFAGLAPHGRIDKGTSHLVSAEMAQF